MDCHKQGCEFYDQRMTGHCSKGEPPGVIHCPIRMGSKRGVITQLRADLATMTAERDALRGELERIKGGLEERAEWNIQTRLGLYEDIVTARREGAESMKERMVEIVERNGWSHCSCIDLEKCASCRTVDEILEDIRALPVEKEKAEVPV